MVFSPLASTGYRGSISPVTEGQPRRDGHSGRLFTLQQGQVANDDASDLAIQKAAPQETSSPVTQSALEKWMRLMGATRQLAYQDEEQAPFQSDAANTRYRLQRTYFDQERQAIPQSPERPDQRLQAYRNAALHDADAVSLDFVV